MVVFPPGAGVVQFRMMDDPILWAVVCFGIALLLFILELFIPSGGLLGVGMGLALITGIVLLFQVNKTMGLVGALVAVALLPVLIALLLKVWPDTPIARMLMLHSPGQPDRDEDEPVPAAAHPHEHLVGATGTAMTDLHPVGTCRINGQRIECLAEGGIIRRGSNVKVVAADGMQVKVRKLD